MDEQVRCPHCGGMNTPAPNAAPYFCRECKRIVDPNRAIPRPSGSNLPPPEVLAAVRAEAPPPSAPSSPTAAAAAAHATPGYVSRYGTGVPRELAAGPTARAVGGSLGVGLLLSAGAALVGAVALGWFGEHVFRWPLVFPFLLGWAIKRVLALGSGGGTPDRGVVGGLVFLGILLAAFLAWRWVEWRSIAARRTDHYQEAYGVSPARATADAASVGEVIAALRERAKDGDASVRLSDGTTVRPDEERARLDAARVTGRRPADGYDLDMLAATGTDGFRGHFAYATKEGQELRLVPGRRGMQLPGFAVLVLWVLEFGVLALTAFSSSDD